jgi:hypothetical protein
MHDLLLSLFSWIPGQNAPVVAGGLQMASLSSSAFLIACAPLAILCVLSVFPFWARLNDSPWVFTITHSLPFFILTFLNSLGDAGQVIDGVYVRYHMSEPLATWTHYWFFRFLHEPFNIGARDAVAWSSRVGGVLYVFFIAKVSLRLFPDLTPTRRLLHRLLFLTAGVSFLCYGYIENPPLALPAEQLWIFASLVFLAAPRLRNAAGCAAALALATAMHGRVGFLFPAMAFGLIIPSGSIVTRFTRLAVGCSVYFGLLGALVAYIFNFEPQYISGGAYGNVTGGGNRQMFVALDQIFTREHLSMYLKPMLIAGGILAPVGLLRLLTMWFKPSRVDIWCLGFLAANLVYVLLWEFDYGPYNDWDLVFSAVTPLLLLASQMLVRSPIPVACFLPFLLATVLISNTYATMVNSAPLNVNVVPTAVPAPQSLQCATQGLRRTYYGDRALSAAIGTPEADVPFHEYGPGGIALPPSTPPVGAHFEGYISIPEPGRYRFFVTGQRNVRMRIGGHLLVEQWIDYEWRVGAEREVRFMESGRYPISIDFYTANHAFPLMLEIESAKYRRRKIQIEDLCHD